MTRVKGFLVINKQKAIKEILFKNLKYLLFYVKKNVYSSLNLKEKFFMKIFFKFNLIRVNFYLYLFWNYFVFTANRYFYFTKFFYFQTVKVWSLRNFHLYLYLNTLDKSKNYLVKLQAAKTKIIFSKKRKKAVDLAKLKRIVSLYDDFQIPWQLLNLRLANIGWINYNLYLSIKKLNNMHIVVGLSKPLFVNLYNQHYLLNGYFQIKYELYNKFNFPYNIYYSNFKEVSMFDVFFFLHKFCGIFTKCGNKNYSLNLIRLFNLWCKKDNLHLYTLLKYFIFNYMPFVYLKVIMVNRRRITRPTLLTKEKSFFLAIKWWTEAAIVRKERSLAYGLFLELLDLKNNKGLVVSKFNNLLLSTYNARSDLKVKNRKIKFKINKENLIYFNKKRRKFLNKFIYNFKWTPKVNFESLYRLNVIKQNSYFNRILFSKKSIFSNYKNVDKSIVKPNKNVIKSINKIYFYNQNNKNMKKNILKKKFNI